jgi:hypothetical protein
VFTDEDNDDVQITKGGLLNLDDVTLASAAVLMALIYPVGSIYTSVVSTNPGTLLGMGTWTAFGAGKVLVGLDAGQTEFDVVEETGGEKTHTLTTGEMPAHTHTIPAVYNADDPGSKVVRGSTGGSYSPSTNSTGGDGAHNNLQPYIVVYMWKRTA